MTPTLLHIRYYDQHIHPDVLRGRGLRGRLIRFLNWVRFWTETLVQRLVAGAMLETAGVAKPARSEVVRAFWEDVHRERAVAAQESPLAPPPPVRPGVSPRSLRYEKGRSVRVDDVEGTSPEVESVERPTRPQPIDAMAARYGAPPRQRRYALHGQRVVFEEEFEPLTAAEPTKTET
jgi:hypothetical protein